MRCPNCGRENPDIRLFCSRCGELLPEKGDAAVQEAPQAVSAPDFDEDVRIYRRPSHESGQTAAHAQQENEDNKAAAPVNAAPSAEDPLDVSDTDFYLARQRSRKVIEEAWPGEISHSPAPPKRQSLFEGAQEQPRRESGGAYARSEHSSEPARPVLNRRETFDNGRASTIIPKRNDALDPDDFFAVRGQVPPDYDQLDDDRPVRSASRGDEFEESAPQSFAVRHMRGIVTLALLAVTAAIVFIWANTGSAQRTLARVDIAWQADAYAQLGQEYYAAGDLSAAGYYYSRALARDDTNANYAIAAANAYIEGGYTFKALEALRECIEIMPENAELYVKLMELQSGYVNMSEADRQLVDRGYALTGDDRLNMK